MVSQWNTCRTDEGVTTREIFNNFFFFFRSTMILYNELLKTAQTTSIFRCDFPWLVVIRQQAITWANVDLDLCNHYGIITWRVKLKLYNFCMQNVLYITDIPCLAFSPRHKQCVGQLFRGVEPLLKHLQAVAKNWDWEMDVLRHWDISHGKWWQCRT